MWTAHRYPQNGGSFKTCTKMCPSYGDHAPYVCYFLLVVVYHCASEMGVAVALLHVHLGVSRTRVKRMYAHVSNKTLPTWLIFIETYLRVYLQVLVKWLFLLSNLNQNGMS